MPFVEQVPVEGGKLAVEQLDKLDFLIFLLAMLLAVDLGDPGEELLLL